ncbi:tRNA-dihydrouridine synthase B [Paucidesulfovibrio gracilis DSM 16080]|uniref:tRNA-dihydrouridine synthase n=2 Tax=Paucidesulfovibrio TaxID=2910985 RepID=A0A1T4WBP1_9BACT|nr:tRNA-dihydrouridine synthase B [Paucidesulfovibrio gracilis DSM 16080]
MNTLPIRPEIPWLAPLAGYSDLPFRMLCRAHGAGVTNTEMVSAKGLCYFNRGTSSLLNTHPEDAPLVVQLFGADPDSYHQAMDKTLEMGFRFFDLNAGCPVRKVTKSGSGSRLLENPDRLYAIAEIMVNKAGPGAVGVKTRLGWEKGVDTFLDVAKRLEDIGVAWLTLHPRYGKQLFSGQADWSRLAEVKQAVSIPIVGSGDLYTAEAGVRCLRETGIDAVMFARGAMFDPAIFERFHALMRGEESPPRDGEHLARIVRMHIQYTREFDGSDRSFRKLRSFIPRYAKGLRDIRSLRNELISCETWEALESAASRIREMQPADPLGFDPADVIPD